MATTAATPQKYAVRRLVQGADGQTRVILVDAYTYQPITDTTGYNVVDVGDVPEKVQDVTQPDAEKPVKAPADKTPNGRGGSEFGGVPSRSSGSPLSTARGAFPSAPRGVPSPSRPAVSPPSVSTPTVGSNLPGSTVAPSTPSNPPGYSQPGVGSDTSSAPSSTPSAPSAPSVSAPSAPSTPGPQSDMNNNGAYGPDHGIGWTGANNTTSWGGYGNTPSAPADQGSNTLSSPSNAPSGGANTPAGMGNTVDGSSFGGYTSQSGNNNGRGANAYFSNSGPALGNAPDVSAPSAPSNNSFGNMYGNDVGYGGGYVDGGSTARSTIDSASTPQSSAERSQASAMNALGNATDNLGNMAGSAGLGIAGPAGLGGSRSWRDNNPGNIEYGGYAVSQGAVNTDGRFAQFASYDDGRKAMQHLLFDTPAYSKLTVEQAINKYAPAIENNVPAYLAALGIDPTKKMADLTPEQQQAMLDNMQAHEGYKVGTPYTSPDQMAAMANAGTAGAYQASPDYGPSASWGSFASPFSSPAEASQQYGPNYGQSAIDPGWGSFAGGSYASQSGGGNGNNDSGQNGGLGPDHGPGWGGMGGSSGGAGSSGSFGGGGGYSSNSGNGNGRGSSGSGYGGSGDSGFGGGGGYSSDSGNGNGRGPSGSGYSGGNSSGSIGGGGDENGDTGGGGAGTRSNGAGSYGGL